MTTSDGERALVAKCLNVADDILEGRCTGLPSWWKLDEGHLPAQALLKFGTYFMALASREGSTDQALDTTANAVKACRAASILCPIEHPVRLQVLGDLGNALLYRSRYSGASQVSEEAEGLDLLRQATSSCEPGSCYHLTCLDRLSHYYMYVVMKYGHILDLEKVSKVITLQKEVLHYRALQQGDQRKAIQFLSVATMFKAKITDDPNDILSAIEYGEQALHLGLEDPMSRCSLAESYLSRFGSTGDFDFVFRAKDLCLKAVDELVILQSAKQYPAKYMLARILHQLFTFTGDDAQRQEGIRLLREALSKQASLNDADSIRMLRHLAIALCGASGRVGSWYDLDEANTLVRNALTRCLPGHPQRAELFFVLSCCLLCQHELNAQDCYLDESIQLLQQEAIPFVQSTGRSHKGEYLAKLGAALFLRARLDTGTFDDIEKSIHALRDAAELFNGDHLRFGLLHDLSTSLLLKAQNFPVLPREDINEAIELAEKALSLCPKKHANRWIMYDALARAYRWRFTEFKQAEDIQRAIQFCHELCSLFKKDCTQLGVGLLELALCHSARARIMRRIDDVDQTLKIFPLVLQLVPVAHIARMGAVSNYAIMLAVKYDTSQEAEHLETYRKVFKEAMEGYPLGSNGRCMELLRLSAMLAERALASVALEDVLTDSWADEALVHFLEAINTTHAMLGDYTMKQAAGTLVLLIGLRSLTVQSKSEICRVIPVVLSFLPRVAYFGIDVKQRLNTLLQAQQFVVESAAFALESNQSELCLQVLEEGRGTFWSQALKLRSRLDELPTQLREKMRQLAQYLERSGLQPFEQLTGLTRSQLEAEGARRRRAAEEFSACIEQARAIPTLEHFMLPPPVSALFQASSRGPIVILIATEQRGCHAIVVKWPEELLHVNLEGLNKVDVENFATSTKKNHLRSLRATKMSSPIRGAGSAPLEILWRAVAHPVLGVLGIQPQKPSQCEPNRRTRQRIFWCPTGAFTFLPIHAAGNYKGSSVQCCSDYVVSSYTPTLTTLINARQPNPPVHTAALRALLIAEDSAPGMPVLPSTIEEVREIAALFPDEGLLLPLSRAGSEGATLESVSANLSQAHVVHFACHGVQDTEDPLESGFCLRNGRLTVQALMQFDLRDAKLAFCSACETAKGDSSQPDQMIHLAAALLFAGFDSVVATMWSMNDIDGPVVAKAVYRELLKGEFLDLDVVPFALDSAVRKLRAQGLPPSRWAPYIHLGC